MQNANKKIGILVATFNGETFLGAQLDSLLNQTHKNILILIRDDRSTDRTCSILRSYEDNYPDKIKVVDAEQGTLGARGNFSFLLTYGINFQIEFKIDYFAFCDQDDIWDSKKLEKQLGSMISIESESKTKKSLPVLIHSDLEVVNEKAERISSSLISYQGLEISKNNFSGLLTSNLVTGCTAMFNPALAELAMPIPRDALMHDWWIAIVASAFGKIGFVDEALVKYRQHAVNTIGAKKKPSQKRSQFNKVMEILFLLRSVEISTHLYSVAEQSKVFQQRYNNELTQRLRVVLRLSSWMKTNSGLLQYLIYRLLRRINIG
tara:strand:- start:1718 stop:2677 length:960 start_codon:yes stop_codon:yes gene_type:complete